MIALSKLKFRSGTYSTAIDAVARAPIWAEQIKYGHGTGHGVGNFANVHEEPQSILANIPNENMRMRSGMITSNEPCIYREGRWVVRIENLLLCNDAGNIGFGDFLEFETLTLCPIDMRCVEISPLNAEEKDWLNRYHE